MVRRDNGRHRESASLSDKQPDLLDLTTATASFLMGLPTCQL